MKDEHSSAIVSDERRVTTSPRKARSMLLLLLLLSCCPPLIYYRVIDESLEYTWYPWGFLPAHFLFLRHYGQLSACCPVTITAAIAWSFFRPAHIRQSLTFIMVAYLVFTVAFA